MEHTHFLVEILKYDKKTTSYKMALLRAINDFVFNKHEYADGGYDNFAIALDDLAASWIGYYWPFVNREFPILQGIRTTRNGVVAQDISFRFALTDLKEKASEISANFSLPYGGYKLLPEAFTSPTIFPSFKQALKEIQKALLMPMRYAGRGEWSIFSKPQWLSDLPLKTQVIHPFPRPNQRFLVISRALWKAFYELSFLLEAICIHEWVIYTQRCNSTFIKSEEVNQVYLMLSERPGNRLPANWELLCTELEEDGDQTSTANHLYTNPSTTQSASEKGIRESYLSSNLPYIEKSITYSVLLESRQQKIASAAEYELRGHGRPLHYTILTRMVSDRYPDIKVSERQMLSTLRRQSQKFQCVYDGTFQVVQV